MQDVMNLMLRFARLKRTVRTGWNMEFPPEYRFKTRKVKEAESVADHSWSVAMFALLMADKLRLDAHKIVWMALVHDVAELVTLDIVTATLDKEEKARVVAEKLRLEDAAMKEIFLPMGDWGERCYGLWQEYEAEASAEAHVLRQIDKLEACIQALAYREDGHEVDPHEFFNNADDYMIYPEFVSCMAILRERATAGRSLKVNCGLSQ